MSTRRAKHEEHEEHVNHERWLITYADMITLLMVLFIVLFAMGQTDLAKYKKLRHSLSKSFGGPDQLALLDGGTGINSGGASPEGITPHELAANAALAASNQRIVAWQTEKAVLDHTKAALQRAFATHDDPVVSDPEIEVRVESRGLIISINSDEVLFAAGSAILRSQGQGILDRISTQIVALPNPVVVEGHTDNVPITGTYPSNWELSTARASSVLRDLMERHHLPTTRAGAAGFADQRPIATNTTSQGRAHNRRVEIVVEARVSDPGIDTAVDGSTVRPTNTLPAKDS